MGQDYLLYFLSVQSKYWLPHNSLLRGEGAAWVETPNRACSAKDPPAIRGRGDLRPPPSLRMDVGYTPHRNRRQFEDQVKTGDLLYTARDTLSQVEYFWKWLRRENKSNWNVELCWHLLDGSSIQWAGFTLLFWFWTSFKKLTGDKSPQGDWGLKTFSFFPQYWLWEKKILRPHWKSSYVSFLSMT